MTKRYLAYAFVIVVVLAVVAQLGSASAEAKAQRQVPGLGSGPTRAPETVQNQARARGSVRVIVGLRVPFRPESAISDLAARGVQRAAIATAQDDLLSRVRGLRAATVKRLETVPFVALEVDAAQLADLESQPDVASIEEDVLLEASLAESVPLIGAPTVWASGYTGAGQMVAILDTGVDKTHPFLGGRVVSEACYSTNGTGQSSVCPGGVTASTASGSGVNCSVTGCDHGTHVAGIAAGQGSSFSGVAKDAQIAAIQVFTRFDNASDCGGTAPCIKAYDSDIQKGLERVYALRGTYNIASVNLSLGGGGYTATCDGTFPSMKSVIDTLRAAGIATIVASGNESRTDGLAFPACISTSVSVGSVDDGSYGTTADAVSSFSNSASFLTLLAPGKWITSSVPGGGFATWAGTSMAAPHVTGAWALMKQKSHGWGVDAVLASLTSSGVSVTDTRNAVVKPRIRVDRAPTARVTLDVDGDGKSDAVVWRSGSSTWYARLSGTGGGTYTAVQWGDQAAGDVAVPGDYDGDGKVDIAVWRPSTGTWYVLKSSGNYNYSSYLAVQWGVQAQGDVPVPGDYDGDGKTDIAVWRPSTGTWYVLKSSDNYNYATFVAYTWGSQASGDTPVAGDYDGDGRTDLAVWRGSSGTWYILKSSDLYNPATYLAIQWGDAAAGDIPVAGDYDGDGKTDPAVWRPSSGTWYWLRSSDAYSYATFGGVQWGVQAEGDTAVPADYDGDGKMDLAVWRATTGMWYVLKSSDSYSYASYLSWAWGSQASGDAAVRVK